MQIKLHIKSQVKSKLCVLDINLIDCHSEFEKPSLWLPVKVIGKRRKKAAIKLHVNVYGIYCTCVMTIHEWKLLVTWKAYSQKCKPTSF
jgi:hypothetical protein